MHDADRQNRISLPCVGNAKAGARGRHGCCHWGIRDASLCAVAGSWPRSRQPSRLSPRLGWRILQIAARGLFRPIWWVCLLPAAGGLWPRCRLQHSDSLTAGAELKLLLTTLLRIGGTSMLSGTIRRQRRYGGGAFPLTRAPSPRGRIALPIGRSDWSPAGIPPMLPGTTFIDQATSEGDCDLRVVISASRKLTCIRGLFDD